MTLVPGGIRDASNLAIDRCAKRMHGLPLAPLLTHLVDAAGSDVLPHMAARFHVLHTVAWRRSGNDKAKRGLIKAATRRHQIKGTLAGLKLAAADAGCQVVRAITPPAKVFPSPALTVAEHNAFVAKYPQLRIYRHRTVGRRVGLHCGDTLGRWMPVHSDALLRIMPRAYLFRAGGETELAVIERTVTTAAAEAETVTVTEAAIPGAAGRLSFAGAHPRFLTVTEAARRFYRVVLRQPYIDSVETLRRETTHPGLDPIDVRPDAVAQTGQATGVHAGRFVARYLTPSTARDRIYQRLYLFDPEVEVGRRTATLHLNAGRLGMPPHHAEVAVRITDMASPLAAGRYVYGHLVATAKTKLADCLEAMRDMARGSDRIAIDTHIKRPATAGSTVVAGRVLAGAWISHL